MTEREWMAATDPVLLLRWTAGQASDRQVRMFATACCWHAWPLIADPVSRLAIEVASRYAEGEANRAELEEARRTVTDWHYPAHLERMAARGVCEEQAEAVWVVSAVEQLLSLHEVERQSIRASVGTVPTPRYTALYRDIFGNPFRPVAFAPDWRTSTAVALAREMYESRDFSAMPILADALQDAGCDSEEILNHCRGSGPHVRGCWVVDLVLGKV
ncbi:hypothetical protein [Gemmata sp.]|uniref:hypothetical protein n=1 Tax=Gemmata sp. TaxID=1914242 RepID=UPI003F72D5EF